MASISRQFSRLNNPVTLVTLVALAVMALARGLSYVGPYLTAGERTPADPGPSLPGLPVFLVGIIWGLIGLGFLVSIVFWRWFTIAASVMGGAYLTWAVVFLADLITDFEWGNVLSISVYITAFLFVLTLSRYELEGDRWGRSTRDK